MTSNNIAEPLPDYEDTPPYTAGSFVRTRLARTPTFVPSILNISSDGTKIISSAAQQVNRIAYQLTSSLLSAGPTTAIRIHRFGTHATDVEGIPVYVIAERYARPMYPGSSSLSDLEISQSRGRWTFTHPFSERDGRLGSLRTSRSNPLTVTSSSQRYQNSFMGGVGLIGAGREEVSVQRPTLSFEDEKWRDAEGVVIATSMQSGDGSRVLRTSVEIEEKQMDLLVAAWCVSHWGVLGKQKKRRFSLFGS